MGKYFPAFAQHAKAREFLDLKQGTMTVLKYVAKFTELARFTDDYVATDITKMYTAQNKGNYKKCMKYHKYIEGCLGKSHKKFVKVGQIGHRSRLQKFTTREIYAVFQILPFFLHFPSNL